MRETLQQKRKRARDKAMPGVKQLVKKFSRTTIQSCLNNLRDYEKKVEQLEIARLEVQKLEKEAK